jgi:dihydrofolate reductase
MQISLIAALDRNNLIGADQEMPWHLPADLKRFKAITMGKPIVMGRKTYETLGRPLPGRHNIILTHNREYQAEGCTVVHSIDEALEVTSDATEVMIIGGGAIYRQFLPLASRLYLTLIDATFEGDTYFPAIDYEQWQIVSEEQHPQDERNPYPFRLLILERKNAGDPAAQSSTSEQLAR